MSLADINIHGTKRIVQWLRVYTDLTEDLSFVPSINAE